MLPLIYTYSINLKCCSAIYLDVCLSLFDGCLDIPSSWALGDISIVV